MLRPYRPHLRASILALLGVALVGACSEDALSGLLAHDTLGGESDTGGVVPVTDSVTPDTTPGPGADIDASVTPEPDVDEPEPDVVITPGAIGWACEENEECTDGWCITTAQGSKCSQVCIDQCDLGWTCQQVQVAGGGDVAYICVPPFTHLCDPCDSHADCTADNVSAESRCVSYGDQGSFCGAYCGANGVCPDGYSCKNVPVGDGQSSEQCVPDSGVCSCSPLAIATGADTTCSASSDFGSCDGERQCGAGGLSACSAAPPAPETCNGEDDDCDGAIDDDCDGDTIDQAVDNCPLAPNTDQLDTDGDSQGDACDLDDDNDNIPDAGDCEPTSATAYPGATEVCDQLDNDCDGSTDESLCDDLNACTDNLCAADGSCANPPNIAPCDDGSSCTLLDQCSGGTCQGGGAPNCDDGNSCTTDTCDALSGCKHADVGSGPCDDGDPCTTGDVCQAGDCVAGTPNPCNDGDQCTTDGCGDNGCIYTATNPCNDSNLCTNDVCLSSQCVFQPIDGTCNDGSVCTQVDLCNGGQCKGGSEILCDDGKPCTDNRCDSKTGCYYPNGNAPCEDGNVCTGPDVCQQGTCVTGPAVNCDDGDPCTTDACSTITGCVHTIVNPCTDGEKCTDDVCEPKVGCKYPPNSDACNDGNACTVGDKCQGGACVGIGNLSCDDGKVCTMDQCNPVSGCFYTQMNSGSCNDGNLCTTVDSCIAGNCVGSGAKNCDDGNECTDDSCDAVAGCKYQNNNDACFDGEYCTTEDKCAGGQCVGQGDYCAGTAGCFLTLCVEPLFSFLSPGCFCL
ncbi:MAG: putative metal-binding motif-containing protein [Myxococcales bacterium]|nr:putative metal-binding motif-containing protein [Myxococcales bacterium]